MFYDYMIYIVFDFMMAVIMFLFGMWFYKSEGKAANFLSVSPQTWVPDKQKIPVFPGITLIFWK